MATYSGLVVAVIPEKASYAQGEAVRAKVQFRATRAAQGTWDMAWFTYHAAVKVYVDGALVDEDQTVFASVIPPSVWTVVHETRYLNLGAMPAHALAGRVDILCGG